MKKFFITFLALSLTIASFGQLKFRGSMVEGATANSMDIVIRPNQNFNGYLLGVVFVVQVPTLALQPTFTLSSQTTYFSSFTTLPPLPGATHVSYYFSATNSATTTPTAMTSTSDYPVLRITMNGGNASLTDLRLAHLADGGPGTLYQFYVEANTGSAANDYTNYAQMFYGPIVAPATALADEGTGYSTYQYMQSGAMPLKWLSFTAEKQNNSAILRWRVADQVNNDRYEIEAASDPQSMVKIGQLAATDNVETYSFTDLNFNKHVGQYVYYRIKQVDKDGRFSYSEIRKLAIDGKEFNFGIVTNPVKGRELKIKIQAGDNSKGTMRIFDLNGKQVYQNNVNWASGYSEQIIQIPGLASGSYVVSLTTGKEQYHAKFVK